MNSPFVRSLQIFLGDPSCPVLVAVLGALSTAPCEGVTCKVAPATEAQWGPERLHWRGGEGPGLADLAGGSPYGGHGPMVVNLSDGGFEFPNFKAARPGVD